MTCVGSGGPFGVEGPIIVTGGALVAQYVKLTVVLPSSLAGVRGLMVRVRSR